MNLNTFKINRATKRQFLITRVMFRTFDIISSNCRFSSFCFRSIMAIFSLNFRGLAADDMAYPLKRATMNKLIRGLFVFTKNTVFNISKSFNTMLY